MAKTVIGLYESFHQAEETVRELVENGLPRENISVIANDAEGRNARDLGVKTRTEEDKGDAAAAGAGIGAAVGGIGGLLVGLGAFMIPGIGPILGAGPLVAALGGAGIGAVTGGMIGALTESGVPEQDANIFAEGVRRGGTLVMVYTTDDQADRAADVINRHQPLDIEERGASWQEEQQTGFNQDAEPFAFDKSKKPFRERDASSQLDYGPGARSYIAGQAVRDYDRSQADMGNLPGRGSDDWRVFESRFREDFDNRYARSGRTWNEYRDYYRYGFDMAREGRYANADWDMIRNDIRRDWETRFHDRPWDEYEAVVYHGWHMGRTPQ